MPSRGNRPRTAILGAGRVGTALTRALRAAGYPAVVVPQSPAGWARAKALHLPTLHWFPVDAEVMFLCVPDGKIRSLCDVLVAEGRVFRGRIMAHCAGALGLDALVPAQRHGAHAGSLHPLTSVPSAQTSLEGVYAAIDGDAKAVRVLSAMARDMGMRPFSLRRGERIAYHAAAALASNGLVALAYAAQRILTRAGLSPRRGLAALLPLMDSAVQALREEGLPGALTGPLTRYDDGVVAAHLAALKRDSDTLDVYRTLMRLGVDIAVKFKGADKKALARLRRTMT